MKICTCCKTLKPLTEFHVRRLSPDGHYGECKQCRNGKHGRNYRKRVGIKYCQWCNEPLIGPGLVDYHPECRILATRAAKNLDKWQCEPLTCRHYAACRVNVRLGVQLPCQPKSVGPIPFPSLDVTSEFDRISLVKAVRSER